MLDKEEVFKPYYRSDYQDHVEWLAKRATLLIPTNKQLSKIGNDFVKGEYLKYRIIAGLIHFNGLPEDFSDYVRVKRGINHGAYNHLRYFTRKSIKDMVIEGLELEKKMIDIWFIAFYGFLLREWFNEYDLNKIHYLDKFVLYPPSLLKYVNKPKFIKETLILKEIVLTIFNNESHFNNLLSESKQLVDRINFYGVKSSFHGTIKFHSYVNDIGAYSLVSNFLNKKDDLSKEILSLLLTYYCSLETIKELNKHLL